MVSTKPTFEQQDDAIDDFISKKPQILQQLDNSESGGCIKKGNGCKAREEANDYFLICTNKEMIEIVHNAIDDHSNNLESALGISILHEIKEDLKKGHILDQQEEHDRKINLKEENTGLATDSMLTC
eukprot:1314838-Ditylum_brightwellii.AAC.1